MANIRELRQDRLKKLQELQQLGFDPYTQQVSRSNMIGEIVDAADDMQEQSVTIAGRITSIRLMGGVSFIDVTDESGKVQAFVRKGEITSDAAENKMDFGQLKLVDSGDYVEVQGTVGRTKTGELSIMASQFRLLSKSIRSLPDVHEGLKNVETRYRQRYVDLHINTEVRKVIEARITIVKEMRNFLEEQGFVDIETPILQPIYGGASARPFTTYHNKLESDLFLRIADELYLKRAVMAGFEKVYEIGHDFRNEGIDPAHNPEFTMLEFYWAYADYNDLMDLTEAMLERICMAVLGSTKVSYKGMELDFKQPLPRISFKDAILEHSGVDIDAVDRDEMIELCKQNKVDIDLSTNPPMKDLIDEFFKTTTRPKLTGPLFLIDYPAVMKPLAKTKHDDPTKSASVQLVVGGEEILNAYNELNDPIEQLKNWQAEQKVLDAGESEEAQPIDYDFIRALEYGMPPTAGWGMGVDRLTQILTDQPSVKDTILFPTLRRESFDELEFESEYKGEDA